MVSYHHKKPAIEQSWLRVTLFVIIYFLAITSIGVIAGLIQKSTAGSTAGPQSLAPAFFTYLIIVINAIVSFLLVGAFRKLIDRQSFLSLGFEYEKNGVDAGVGFFIGILILCIGTFILIINKNLSWTNINFNATDLFISLGFMLIVAFYEEVVFRGYILNNLLASVNKWLALLITATLFALAHSANPDFSIIPAINIFLAGILLGINYIYTKNLWFAIMLHFSWNFFQGPILGYKVSGLNMQSLLEHELRGNDLLTGGNFGFEGSILATILYAAACITLVYVYEKKYAHSSQGNSVIREKKGYLS